MLHKRQHRTLHVQIIAEREAKTKSTVRLPALGGFYMKERKWKMLNLKASRKEGCGRGRNLLRCQHRAVTHSSLLTPGVWRIQPSRSSPWKQWVTQIYHTISSSTYDYPQWQTFYITTMLLYESGAFSSTILNVAIWSQTWTWLVMPQLFTRKVIYQ